jgi:ABC-type lipopolysaccharide export system ATPase subunit
MLVEQLSGGNFRIIELYCILKSKAQFIMLDEPFSHISPIQVEKIKDIIKEAKATKGIIISDHMYRHVIDICDNLYILANGKTHLAKSIEDLERLGYARF